MGVPSQSQLLELVDEVAGVVRERNDLRHRMATVNELLDAARTPWASMRDVLAEVRRAVG